MVGGKIKHYDNLIKAIYFGIDVIRSIKNKNFNSPKNNIECIIFNVKFESFPYMANLMKFLKIANLIFFFIISG